MTAFTISIDNAQVLAALTRLQGKLSDLSPALKAAGEDLTESTKQRFNTATAPDGSKWAPNSELTLMRYLGRHESNTKKDGKISKAGIDRILGKKPLTGESHSLQDQIAPEVIGTHLLRIIAPQKYSAMQQFGGTRAEFPHLFGDIPARPFMGLSDEDVAAFEETIRRFLAG